MRRLLWMLRPHRRAVAIEVLIVVGVLLLLAGAAVGLNYWLTDASRTGTSATDISRVRDVVGIVQAFVWAFLIVAGGIFAYRKLQLFRDFEPHLTITQAVTHRPIGTQYVHIAVTATLHNSSKVKVEIRQGFFRLMQIAPIDDDDVEQLYSQAFDSNDSDGIPDIQWPLLDMLSRASSTNSLVIEPGETHLEPGEFIVSNEVKTVLLYSYFYNSNFFESSQSAPGWAATTVYDMVTGN